MYLVRVQSEFRHPLMEKTEYRVALVHRLRANEKANVTGRSRAEFLNDTCSHFVQNALSVNSGEKVHVFPA